MTAAFVIFLCLISLLAAALVWGALRGRREADAYVDAMFAPVFAKGALSAEAAFREFDAAIRAGDLIVSRESTDEDLPLPETSAAFFRVFARIEIPRTRLTLDRAHLRTKVPGLVVIGTNGARDVVVRRTTGEVSVSGTTQWYPTLFHFVLAQLELHRSAPEAPAGTGDLVAAARRRALLVFGGIATLSASFGVAALLAEAGPRDGVIIGVAYFAAAAIYLWLAAPLLRRW